MSENDFPVHKIVHNPTIITNFTKIPTCDEKKENMFPDCLNFA